MEVNVVLWSRKSFWAICAGYFVYAAYVSRAQFLAWHADTTLGVYLIPPYRGIGYFFRYAFVHFWLPYVISLLVALLFFIGAKWLNNRRNELLFEKEELYFLAIGIFVSGHPGWIFYLLIVFSAYLLASLISTLFYGPHTRISFYYFWLPCAAVTVTLTAYLHEYAWYANLLI